MSTLGQWMRLFSIRLRMNGAIAMVLTLLLLVGGVGLWGLAEVTNGSARFVATTHADTVALGDLRTAMGKVRRYEKDLLINYDSAEQQAVYRPQWRAAVDQVQAKTRQLVANGTPEEAAVARQIDELLKAYVEQAAPVFKAVEIGGFNDAPVANKAIATAKRQAHAAEQKVDELAALLEAQTRASLVRQQAAAQSARAVFAGALALALLLVAPMTLLNSHSITAPMLQARELALAIADGDLTRPVPTEGRDEAADLLRALAHMQGALRRLVGEVREASGSIQLAANEVASGNADLSGRTERTAGSLQQTASSMQQLTHSVQHSADSARHASTLAASASSVAERGGSVVAEVVSTMGEINAASHRIADIIGTIDGIAFQTNILALNAAVEAARAGEQGRGFAVVAGEVRSLAQRSAEAAREIKTLIGASVDKVDNGARLVRDAGSTMGDIVASVQRVTDTIRAITTAASEQSEGIGQVNGAVNALDAMTQQNAALVEQSAAAAESLKGQASRLHAVVARFRVEATPAA